MAESTLDVEQAPAIHTDSTVGVEKTQPSNTKLEADEAKPQNVEAEKVVILSFRSLQLRRIAELQDELLGLSGLIATGKTATGTPLPDDHKSTVDCALRNYAEAIRNYETLSLNALPTIPVGSRLVGLMAFGGVEPAPKNFVARLLSKLFPSRWLGSMSKWKVGMKPGTETVRDTVDAIVEEVESRKWKLGMTPMVKVRDAVDAIVKEVESSKLVDSLALNSPQFGQMMSIIRLIMVSGATPGNIIEAMELTTGNLGFRELDQNGRILRAQKTAFTERIVMALFGGVALIGPMLVMTLHPSRNTSLITVSAATFLFALVLALVATDSDGKDVLAATAAYAAVLVVFVGTSSGGGS